MYERRMRIDRALDLDHKALSIKALSIRRKAIGDHVFAAFTLDAIRKCQLNLNGDIKEALLCFDETLVLYRVNGIAEDDPLVWEAKKT